MVDGFARADRRHRARDHPLSAAIAGDRSRLRRGMSGWPFAVESSPVVRQSRTSAIDLLFGANRSRGRYPEAAEDREYELVCRVRYDACRSDFHAEPRRTTDRDLPN